MESHLILGVHVNGRVEYASSVQSLLTEYGEHIKTRLGLHEISAGMAGSPNGLILLEMVGDGPVCHELAAKLNAVSGVAVQKMTFDHP